MSQSRMPYQCMVKCENLLIAARGSSVDSFSLQDGSIVSTWKCPSMPELRNGQSPSKLATKLVTQNSGSSSVETVSHASSPPAKKRKLSASEPADPMSVRKEGKKNQNNRSDAVASGLEAPAIIALAITNGGRHVIAVTGEDKSIRVFENNGENGVHQLKQLSQRVMPKRPCSVTVTDDNSTIICADKFGDVYSLPLIPVETSETPKCVTNGPEPLAKPFTPAANELTIHSQRNRKALENQRRQTNKNAEKSEPVFEHKLLLGHVSMLTDIALVTLGSRSYVITSDRDEHIRISRGIPQAHIIEEFCFGHTEFVSRICISMDRPQILVSGGGDDDLFVWEWEFGNLASKTELKKYVSAVMQDFDNGSEKDVSAKALKIAVSGIYYTKQFANEDTQNTYIVTCEGVPALFTFILTAQNRLEHIQTLKLPGNALAVVSDIPTESSKLGLPCRLLVSIDTIHKPGSITDERDNGGKKLNPLQSYEFQHGQLVQEETFEMSIADQNEVGVNGCGNVVQITTLLYNLENLRKREGETQDE